MTAFFRLREIQEAEDMFHKYINTHRMIPTVGDKIPTMDERHRLQRDLQIEINHICMTLGLQVRGSIILDWQFWHSGIEIVWRGDI